MPAGRFLLTTLLAACRLRPPWRLLCILTISAQTLQAETLENFSLQLKREPQAQFIGYFVADALGYYEQAGLAVEILPGGPGINPPAEVSSGRADAAVEWLATVLAERRLGHPLVNIAQIFQHSSLMLICKRQHDILAPRDLVGRTISVWHDGNEIPLLNGLDAFGLAHRGEVNAVEVVEQLGLFSAWKNPDIDCVSATSYNEYWSLLEEGVPIAGTTVFRFADYGFSYLEDGLYVDQRRLADPLFVARLTRFLRASLRGWQHALAHPGEAVALMLQRYPALDRSHQQRAVQDVLALIDRDRYPLGLMRIDSYDRTVGLLAPHLAESVHDDEAGGRAWTHQLWYQAEPGRRSVFSIEVRYRLAELLSAEAFYLLDLIGTLAFGIAGFARAQQGRYDIWGALVLTSLPAVGGGTLRDLLVGGDRHPPFVFTDPVYLYIVFAIVIIGAAANRLSHRPRAWSRQFPRLLLVIDTIGLAAFCIIGAKVAILAELTWFWIPLLAALTCAGGGVLLDIVTGLEPRTFRGVIYEEIAMLGGLFLFGMLYVANFVENVELFILVSIVATFALVFAVRIAVVALGLNAPRLQATERAGSGS